MSKKDLNNDLFAGGSISDGEGKTKKAKAAKSKKKSKGLSANKIRIIKSVIAAVIVVGLLVAYVATGTVRKGFIHSTLQWTTYLTGVTVKSEEGDKINVPVSTYNYYFALTYNNLKQRQEALNNADSDSYDLSSILALLGDSSSIDVDFDKPFSKQTTTDDDGETITWLEYVKQEALDSIEETYTFYNEAVKANDGVEPAITTTQASQLESTIEEYKDAAESYGYTLSGYFVQIFGKGVTENVFRREAVRSYIAENYQSSISNETATVEHTEEEYAAYKDENIADFQSVNIRVFEADSEENAAAFKNELKADGSNFTELAVKYSSGSSDKSYYADETASTMLYATKASLKNMNYGIAAADDANADEKTYSGLDWLFDADRKTGDLNQFSTTVVYVLTPAELSDINTVNVRHILISPVEETSEAASATDAQWTAALEKANNLLDEFNKGDKSAESFASLAEANSADTGSSSNGGLYEKVYPGQMVLPFNNWCFADDRAAGNTGIVRSQYGYHIMYFDGATETPVWRVNAENMLASEESKTKAEQLEESYTAKVNWFGSRYFEIDTDIDR